MRELPQGGLSLAVAPLIGFRPRSNAFMLSSSTPTFSLALPRRGRPIALRSNWREERPNGEEQTKKSVDELIELTKETIKAEQYWILTERSKLHKPPKEYKYIEELTYLQIELIKMQEWVKSHRRKMCVVFEEREAAGKGGVIRRITDSLNSRVCRVVALASPTERERGQWYFQRYVAELPSAGEIVLFDRSWYNRAGAEHVMGFCTDEEYQEFLRS